MRPLSRVLVVLAAFVAFQGVQACASETPDPGLNPQPLPPEDQKDNTRTPEEAAQDPNTTTGPGGGGSTSGSTSSSGSSGSPVADGDAGDGGDSGDN